MKFEYTVKFNGRLYFPGEDVPMEDKTVAVTDKVAVTEPIENVVLDEKEKPKSKRKSK